MMEESTEAHMETDVSSTTEDVPETQEVTGSSGNVEMVIVVEKVSEEEMEKTDSEPMEQECENKNDVPTQSEISLPKELQKEGQVTPENNCESPVPILKSPIKLDIAQNIIDNDTQVIMTAQAVCLQTEPVDSSSKIDTSMQNGSEHTSPEKILDQIMEEPKPTNIGCPKNSQLQEMLNTPAMDSVLIEKFNMINETPTPDAVNQVSVESTNATPLDVTLERETSNDSQIETNSESSEKEHNKSISRELKSLINSAKESKIISECTQLTSKTRKSRIALDTSLNTSLEADKIQANRRLSSNSQKSNCSEKSDKNILKRSMRSQNPEFVSKVKQFLNSVTSKVQRDSDMSDDDDVQIIRETEKRHVFKKYVKREVTISSPKKKKFAEEPPATRSNKLRSDSYCWRCHWPVEQVNEKAHSPMHCTVCPRSYHFKCLTGTERNKIVPDKNWVCPDCLLVLLAESSETRSPAMKKISLGMLCELLNYALQRMMSLNGVEPFLQPVDRTAFPDYDKYVVHPMDLTLMKQNITDGLYGSTEAFLADTLWILHNSIIFNTWKSNLTAAARALVRSCRAETGEIEACAECYAAAHARRPTWFTDVCSTPHILLWAKLKGFPYWPAKGMSVNSGGQVDVRFFGAHDRAWVPAKDCFLYSEKDPNNFRTKRQDILDSMQEAEHHIRNISRKYGKFIYPPFRTQFEPTKLNEQLKLMIPSFEGEVKPVKDKPTTFSPSGAAKNKRLNSKSSKNLGIETEANETEQLQSTLKKTVEVPEEPKLKANISDKNKIMEMDVSPSKKETSRKRRRSNLEEAVIMVVDNNAKLKRRRSDLDEAILTIIDKRVPEQSKKIESKTTDTQEPSSSKQEENTNEMVPKEIINKEAIQNKSEVITTPISKDNEPSSSTSDKEKTLRVAPLKILLTSKSGKQNLTASIIKPKTPKSNDSKSSSTKVSTPKDGEKSTPNRSKITRGDKTPTGEKNSKEEKINIKQRPSRNKSLNNSITGKPDKGNEKSTDSDVKNDKIKEIKDNTSINKNNVEETEKSMDSNSKSSNADSKKVIKDRLQFDDDTSLAVIARGTKDTVVETVQNVSCMPTISSVVSLSTTAQSTAATVTKSVTTPKTIEVGVSSIFTPTSTDNVRNMQEAVTKLQKLRSDTEPLVGRVGVRAFARMTSPPPEKSKDSEVHVEIKSEPIEIDDAERHNEKMDLMNAFNLRPVNPPTASLREVRINKVVVTPLSATRKTKAVETRPRAKKTFPQPKRPEEGRSELISKNSMVYIPIQPPMTQAPVRGKAPPAVPLSLPTPQAIQPPRPVVSSITTIANSLSNTTTTSIAPPMSTMQSPIASTSSMPTVTTLSSSTNVPSLPTVHTVPLVTSVNGQLMFSLHPVMSVGGIDSAPSPPMVNGITERAPSLVPLSSGPTNVPAIMSAVTVPLSNRTPMDTTTPGELPRLMQRPLLNPLDASVPAGCVPAPPTAGPLSAKLNQNAVKLADFFRTLLEDSLEKLDEPVTQAAALKLQLEQLRWRHQKELEEIKHNYELSVAEMRAAFEKDKQRAVSEARRLALLELDAAVQLAKRKQWCANCSQEAQFYCCWNTSYCDYPCQRAHWAQHYSVCSQHRPQDGTNDASELPPSRLQPQPENLPVLQRSGGAAPRDPPPATPAPARPDSSIIVSMVEGAGGNQVKCLGTYSKAASSSLLHNKQVMNNEDNASKKVVTSGYLIVGAATNSASVVTPSRRTHTVQYYS